MSKIEFIKETKIEQTLSGMQERSMWYTKKDGRFVPDSLSYNEKIARETFDWIKAGKSLEPVIAVVDTYEDEKV